MLPAKLSIATTSYKEKASGNKRKEPPSNETSPSKRSKGTNEVEGLFVRDFEDMNSLEQIKCFQNLIQKASNTSVQYVASLLNSSIKRDFLCLLPKELTQSILKHLDAKTLCQVCKVSKQWRNVVSSDNIIWKLLLRNEGWGEYIEHAPSPSEFHGVIQQSKNFALSIPNYYKLLFTNMYNLRCNWFRNRCSKLTFTCPNCPEAVVTDLRIIKDKIYVSNDGRTVDVFEINTGKLFRTFDDHKSGIWCMEICGPRDNTLVTGSTDKTIKIWDIEKGKCIDTLTGHAATVRCLVITSDPNNSSESLLVTGGRDSNICVWTMIQANVSDLKSETISKQEKFSELLFTLEGHADSVRALAVNGNILMSGSYDCTIKIWDLKSRKCINTLIGHDDKVYCLAHDHKNNHVISGSMDTTIRVWSVETGDCLRVLYGHTGLVGVLLLNYCAFIPRKSSIVKYETLEEEETLTNPIVVSAAVDSRVNVWHINRSNALVSFGEHSSAATCIAMRHDLLVSGGEGEVKLYDLREGQFVRNLITDISGCWKVAINERYCVCAVTRNRRNVFEVFDFGLPPA